MLEEIKEILEIFKKINEEYSVDTELDFEDYEIPNIYLKQLLDYITNLQEENNKLKELCDKYEEEHSTEFKIWKDERHQLLDYKSRNEKAIEIIEKYGKEKQLEEDYLMNRVNLANYNCLLLDTLQGVDKE